MEFARIRNLFTLLLFVFWLNAIAVLAGPYTETGDTALRHDLEYLADRGLVSTPITTWPMSWADVATALDSVDRQPIKNPTILRLLNRLDARVANSTRWGILISSYEVGAYENLDELRTFDKRQKGKFALDSRLSYVGRNFVANVQLGLIDDRVDSNSVRLDGSYIGYLYKNTAILAGSLESWWGPGHAGSLILSSNARPVPGVTIRRNVATPFTMPVLRHLGPWSAQIFARRMETDRGVSNPYLLGARVTIKPFRSLELGVSRTAQWGGEGRPESFSSLIDLIIGQDNVGEGVTREDEPGNQLAGFDARWSLNRFGVPITAYGQFIGEDEAGGFPSRYLGMGGLSTSFAWSPTQSTVRVNLEYSDTTCQFNESSRLFNCAYANGLYPSGYRYRGRAIGHSTDSDSSQLALIATVNSAEASSWQAMIRRGKLNRGGPPDSSHSLSATRQDYVDAELVNARPFRGGQLKVGIGFRDGETVESGQTDRETRYFINWRSRPH
ncbi:MAG: capsule assembly Wzi family protein [Pseudomonadota bacterium]